MHNRKTYGLILGPGPSAFFPFLVAFDHDCVLSVPEAKWCLKRTRPAERLACGTSSLPSRDGGEVSFLLSLNAVLLG
jgi:hypothetical protein